MIEIVPNQIITRQALETPLVRDGQIVSDIERDILKLVVVERHQATGNVGVGFVRGFGLQRGALASTVAHDAHNVVVVGTNDDDIIAAIHALEEMRGGQVAVADGEIKAALALPIAGLVSDQPLEVVIEKIAALNAAAQIVRLQTAGAFHVAFFPQPFANSGAEIDRSGTGRRGQHEVDQSLRRLATDPGNADR